MKIISKYKDYYDYLQGIWGVDPNLVLDRSSFSPSPKDWSSYQAVSLYVCNYQIQGCFIGGEFKYGMDLYPYARKFDENQRRQYRVYTPDRELKFSIQSPWSKYGQNILKAPKLLSEEESPNLKENCPILIGGPAEAYSPFPILKDYNIQRVFTAEQIWLMLTEWLSKQKDKPLSDNRTNREKILTNGFDLKTSFRK